MEVVSAICEESLHEGLLVHGLSHLPAVTFALASPADSRETLPAEVIASTLAPQREAAASPTIAPPKLTLAPAPSWHTPWRRQRPHDDSCS